MRTILSSVLFVTSVLFGGAGCDKLQGAGGADSGSAANDAVSATDVSKAYKDAEAAASAKYDGKPIKVRGVYKGVDPALLNPMLEGVAGGQFLSCDFDAADKPVTKTFKPGQVVTLSCTVEGPYGGIRIDLKHCKML